MTRTIYISWQKKVGEPRYIIAKIKRNVDGMIFSYIENEFKAAQKDGLEYFLGFKNAVGTSSKEIEHLLSLRIISKDRPDRNEFLKFWEAENVTDTFDVLALTQGKSATDNFEFLADFSTVKAKKLAFITDLAYLSHLKLPADTIKKGDKLTYKKEKDNTFDKEAVSVFLGDLKVGYIKKIHNKIFQRPQLLTLTVKEISQNGVIKQVFVKVEK